MKRIYTFGGKPALRNLTVADLRASKGKRKFSQVTASSAEEASAAREAGIDILTTFGGMTAEIRKGAPETFVHTGFAVSDYRSEQSCIDAAFQALDDGADAIYTIRSLRMVTILAEMSIPVMGHLGLVPRHSTWRGGLRAVGKTADEAFELYRDFKRLEDAGAFAVEVEVVPQEVLAEISPRTSLVTFSIGAGSAGDVQFLFMEDVCGDNTKPPKHAKAYGNLHTIRRQLSSERIRALKRFHEEVTQNNYPGEGHVVHMDPIELDKFKNKLEAAG